MIHIWIKRLLKKLRGKRAEGKTPWPTAEEIALLPWFEELRRDQIAVVANADQARRAYAEIMRAQTVGFDTESKPTFRKGEKSEGPHVAQFSTMHRAYVFILRDPECRRIAGRLIQTPRLKKVGFGLGDDLKRLRTKFHFQPREVLDLETVFSARGYGRNMGVKVAVAIVFKRRFRKSRKASTSNWGAPRLTERQILYAANDAYAAIQIFNALTTNPKI